MPRLIVFRHAKSDWGDGVSDHERTLKPRGVRAAKRMGRFLTEANSRPDRVLASSAVRARTTANLAAEAGEWDVPIEVLDELYLCSPQAVIERLREVETPAEIVLFAGHEPTCSELVALLTASAAPAFATATMAGVDLHGAWAELGPNCGRLAFLVPPRMLPDERE